jgi:hypothetical protein
MKRLVLLIIPALIFVIVFASCSKATAIDDYENDEKLEGATWVAERDNIVFTLRFVDKTLCTLGTVRKGNTYSANLTTYWWRYQSIHDSMWALCYLHPTDGEEGNSYYGRVENKKLYLYPWLYPLEGNTEVLCFERKK